MQAALRLLYLTAIAHATEKEGHRLSNFLLALELKTLITETTFSEIYPSEWNLYLFLSLGSIAKHYQRKEVWGDSTHKTTSSLQSNNLSTARLL